MTHSVHYYDPTDAEQERVIKWASFWHRMQAMECADRLACCGLTALIVDEPSPPERGSPRLVLVRT